MKRALFTCSAVGAVCLVPAVQAVDYVQCREMLRTKNQMVDSAARAEVEFRDELLGDECDSDKFQVVAVPAKQFGKVWSKTIYTTDFEAQRACKEERLAKLERVDKPFIAWDGSKLWAPEAIRWAKSQAKVVADMKAAGCPYQ